VRWLVSLPIWVLLLGWLVVVLAAAEAGRQFVRRVVPADERDVVPGLAFPLMPALGATFAVLTAITLSSEAGYLKSAQDNVSAEAVAASRLAWAATSPGVPTASFQRALERYVVATREHEWSGDAASSGNDPAVRQAIAGLEDTVRAAAAVTAIGTPASTELLAALDGVTSGRRIRLAEADRDLPTLYVLTLIGSGLALVANAGVIVSRVGRRSTALVGGLTIVVALSLALLFAITGPFRGAMTVSGATLDAVVDDLRTGFFRHG
jgi:hypothetical protein